MKKTLVSLAAVAALTTGAMAADKGIDIVTTGQAVIYYETHASGATGADDIFDESVSQANVGVQLNLGADLGNNFTFGSQLSYIGTTGLEKNLVSNVKQVGGTNYSATDELALSKIFVAKKIANTTVKIGRQELPKSLSPLAFTEGWNVFKNTFDAILVVNSDIPSTTVVGAYVGTSNSTVGTGLSQMTDLTVGGPGGPAVTGGAYMLTVQNKSVPMTTITATYYHMSKIDTSGVVAGSGTNGNAANAFWVDATVAGKDLPMGLKIQGQFGQIAPDLESAPTAKDTTAFGVKVAMKPMDALALSVAYSSVDDGLVAIKNVGTGIKTPLYTQMVYNQNAISSNADTIVVKGVYKMGDMGKIVAQYGMTSGNNLSKNEYNELDLLYIVKAGGVKYFAGLMHITADKGASIIGGGYDASAAGTSMDDTKLRVWARYAF